MIYFIPYLQMAIGALGIYLGGAYVWTGFVLLFILLPIAEFTFQDLRWNENWLQPKMARASLILTPVALTVILALAFWRSLHLSSTAEMIGLILSGGTLLGVFGIPSAHELVHRRDVKLRALGVYNLMLVNFAHWGLEHVFGHHKNVATPLDPATARKGESLYFFWPRAYFGGLAGAYKIAPLKVITYFSISIFSSILIGVFLGVQTLVIWLLMSVMAILLLQTVDYIEHYGLTRDQHADGFYMAFKPHHAWDTSSLWSNITLFNLGFHSHHHMKATLAFEELKEQPASRRMPYGYSVMVPLAMLPFVYIPMMNQKLNEPR